MLDKYCKVILTFTLMLVVFTSYAQQRRTVTYQLDSGSSKGTNIEAYTLDFVDECPSFPGGEYAMTKFINNERKYPEKSYNAKICGRVLCSFIILPNCAISKIEVLRGVNDELDEEAVRVISKMPKWSPGKVDGEAVAVYYTLAISFRL